MATANQQSNKQSKGTYMSNKTNTPTQSSTAQTPTEGAQTGTTEQTTTPVDQPVKQEATTPVMEEVNVQEGKVEQKPTAAVNQPRSTQDASSASKQITYAGVVVSQELYAGLQKWIDESTVNEAIINDLFSYVGKNRAGYPRTENESTQACKSLLTLVNQILTTETDFAKKWMIVVAVAREFKDNVFAPELVNRGATGLNASDFDKYVAFSTLLIETITNAEGPKFAGKTVDIAKIAKKLGNDDVTNRLTDWYNV